VLATVVYEITLHCYCYYRQS